MPTNIDRATLTASIDALTAELATLNTERTTLLRTVASQPATAPVALRDVNKRIGDAQADLTTLTGAMTVVEADEAAAAQVALEQATADARAQVIAIKQAAVPLAKAVDAAAAAFLDALEALCANGAECWTVAGRVLALKHADDPVKAMDSMLVTSPHCRGVHSGTIATLGRFIHRAVAVMGGGAHHALHDPAHAYRSGIEDFAWHAHKGAQHLVGQFHRDKTFAELDTEHNQASRTQVGNTAAAAQGKIGE
jgi:hypothetical protein